jgi:uncharacterized protein YheU (UPF0270 family)
MTEVEQTKTKQVEIGQNVSQGGGKMIDQRQRTFWGKLGDTRLALRKIWKKEPNTLDVTNSESLLYVPLTPGKVDPDKHEMRVLAHAFGNRRTNQIANIGITGPYGSGKSSLIESFLDNNGHVNPTRVSLANFQLDVAEGKDAKQQQKLIESNKYQVRIEAEIIQQILYSVDGETLPSSRYRRIPKKLHWLKKAMSTSLLAIASGVGIYSGARYLLDLLGDQWITGVLFSRPWSYATFAVSVLVAWPLIWRFVGEARRLLYGIGKIKFPHVEVELAKTERGSMLNEALDEIIHYFEATKSNCLILEDLDRYGSVQLFSSIRELADILRRNPRTEELNIQFIYAVKDDLFKDENRTKFFDLIVPIKPHTSRFNSHIQFRKLNDTMHLGIPANAISDLSTFIESSRVVINICNELKAARGNEQYDLDISKLFALTVYKNLYPDDYAEALQGRGVIPELFSEIENARENLVQEVKHKALAREQDKEPIRLNSPITIAQLQSEYVSKFFIQFNRRNISPSITVDGSAAFVGSTIESAFDRIKSANVVNRNRFDFDEWQLSVHEIPYEDRLSVLQEHGEELIKVIDSDLAKYSEDINTLRSANPADLCKRLSSHVDTEKVTPHQFARFLVSAEYLGENYSVYTISRNEDHFTKTDHQFMLAVKLGSNKPLDNPIQADRVFDALALRDFSRPQILHPQIILHASLNSESAKSKALLKFLNPKIEPVQQVVKSAIAQASDDEAGRKIILWLVQKDLTHAEYLTVVGPESRQIQQLKAVLQDNPGKIDKDQLPQIKRFVETQIDFLETAKTPANALKISIALGVKWKAQELDNLDPELVSLIRDKDMMLPSRDIVQQFAEFEMKNKIENFSVAVLNAVEGLIPGTLNYLERNVQWLFINLINSPLTELEVEQKVYVTLASWTTPTTLSDDKHVVQLLRDTSIHPNQLEFKRWAVAIANDKFIHDWTTANELLEEEEIPRLLGPWIERPDVQHSLLAIDEAWDIDINDATALVEEGEISAEALISIAHKLPVLAGYVPEKISPSVFTALAKADRLELVDGLLDWAESNAPTAGRHLITEDSILTAYVLEGLQVRKMLSIDALKHQEFTDDTLDTVVESMVESEIELPGSVAVALLQKLRQINHQLSSEKLVYLVDKGSWSLALTALVGKQISLGYTPTLKDIRALKGYSDIGPGSKKSIRISSREYNKSILDYAQEKGWIGVVRQAKTSPGYVVYNKK